MPTESIIPAEAHPPGPSYSPPLLIKCILCGSGATTASGHQDGIIVFSEPLERICGSCVRSQETTRVRVDALGLGITGHRDERGETRRIGSDYDTRDRIDRAGDTPLDRAELQATEPLLIPRLHAEPSVSLHTHAQSLPSQHARPWTTSTSVPTTIAEAVSLPPSPKRESTRAEESDTAPNPLLDVTKTRMPSLGRGALYAGSVFKGTQTSGRSAYEVEVKVLDVNFADSTLSGYLNISHLTDAHPHLTTFFTGEIIGPHHGFITGQRYGATEHDDMRHWGRFEQFRRASTRVDMVRPELLFRDPLPDRTRGETKAKERDYVFLRIKERFLVPDHTVRDISGASFAGFYYAMVDLSPPAASQYDPPTPSSPTSPTLSRRLSSGIVQAQERSASRPDYGRRRQSSSKFSEPPQIRGEATMRGYYFHSLNQEPFQELFLTHVPARSSSTMELR